MITAAIHTLARLRLSIFMQGCLMAVGFAQWVFARAGGGPLSAQTWGEAALLFPLEFWALAMIGGSLLTFLGLLYPPNWRLIRIGCVVQVTHMSFLGSSALATGGDPVIFVFAFLMLVPVHLFLALRAGHEH